MKNKKEKIKRKPLKGLFAEVLDVPAEVALNAALISLTGAEMVEIENYKGIIEFSADKVRINTVSGIIAVNGKDLVISRVTSEALTLRGKIRSAEYI
ncbi:sporulation protein YqfC [Clostridia bacterium]|nr:sporulation protein YqfC [Clostridia bacterium]